MSTDPQNTKVQRYRCHIRRLKGGGMQTDPEGHWYHVIDYAALEAQNARLRELVRAKDEALESAKLMIVHGDFKNGVTGEGGYPDEGEVRASEMLSRIQDARDLALDNFPTEKK